MVRESILNKLPWSVQGFLGGRPRKLISFDRIEKKLAFSGSTLLLPAPVTLQPEFHQHFTENFSFPCPPLYAGIIKNGRVFRKHNLFSVITSKNALVTELSIDPVRRKLHPIFTEPYLPKPKFLKGRSLLLATAGCDWVYYHWVADLLPKLAVAEQAGFPLQSFDHIIVNPFTFPAQRASLEKMEVPMEKLVFIGEGDHFSTDELIVPTEVKLNPGPNKYVKRKLLKTSRVNPQKRIFITRGNSQWRNVVNQDELLALLKKYDFEVVKNEGLTFSEQIRLFNDAGVLISTHGSNFTNVMFCSPGARIIELIADWHHYVNFWIIASLNQLEYYHMASPSVPKLEEMEFPHKLEYNLKVDMGKLEWMIQRAIGA